MLDVGDSPVGDFRAGVAPLYVDNSGHWDTAFIDKKGKNQFTVEGYAWEYCEGLALVSVQQKSGDHLYGYIDRQGKFLIEPKFMEADSFSEGLAGVALKKAARWEKGEEWGYIDKTGAVKIEAKFNETRDFRNGLAIVHIGGEREMARHVGPIWQSGEWWLIDREGRKLQKPW
ncbi:MAG TPA: WG repeat-containing protein [Gemmataceae bacterium]|nr:WG repeat-containing protein [Gemmataceae bacterium]